MTEDMMHAFESSETCARAFIAGWVARFGCPVKITTDRGRQFESELFHTLSSILGQSTGLPHPIIRPQRIIERLHRQLKSSIMCHSNTHWLKPYPWCCWASAALGRTTYKLQQQSSSTGNLYAYLANSLRLRRALRSTTRTSQPDFVTTLENSTQSRPVITRRNLFTSRKELSTAEYVFLRQGHAKRSLESPYSGPYKVLERRDKTFRIILNGKPNTVTIDRLKPAFMTSDTIDEDTSNSHQASTIPEPEPSTVRMTQVDDM
ncbi:uncharacterized protein [Choristoneura fumiferana]|uniref:uncharacterized protein n=1 Tax=Choristoneura fumiferana TaxID=7141 RepID=UPI003D15E3CB